MNRRTSTGKGNAVEDIANCQSSENMVITTLSAWAVGSESHRGYHCQFSPQVPPHPSSPARATESKTSANTLTWCELLVPSPTGRRTNWQRKAVANHLWLLCQEHRHDYNSKVYVRPNELIIHTEA